MENQETNVTELKTCAGATCSILLENGDLNNPRVSQGLGQLANFRFSDGKTSYWIMRLCKKYDQAIRQAQETFQELLKKFGHTQEQLLKDELSDDFRAANEAFSKETVDLGVRGIKLSAILEAKPSAMTLMALEKFIVFDVDYSDDGAQAGEAASATESIN